MPRKITQTEVAYQLHSEYIEGMLGIDLTEYTQPTIPITFDTFQRVMMKDDFIGSRPTVRAKWEGLIASGIISQTARERGSISVQYLTASLYLEKKKIKKTIEKKTQAEVFE